MGGELILCTCGRGNVFYAVVGGETYFMQLWAGKLILCSCGRGNLFYALLVTFITTDPVLCDCEPHFGLRTPGLLYHQTEGEP